MLHTAPAIGADRDIDAFGGGGGGGGFGHFHHRSAGVNRVQSSPVSVPIALSRGSIAGTPEDRQRAVAHMLARGGSFSERGGVSLDEELTPDSVSVETHSAQKTPWAAQARQRAKFGIARTQLA